MLKFRRATLKDVLAFNPEAGSVVVKKFGEKHEVAIFRQAVADFRASPFPSPRRRSLNSRWRHKRQQDLYFEWNANILSTIHYSLAVTAWCGHWGYVCVHEPTMFVFENLLILWNAGSTPALVNPSLSVVTPTGGGGGSTVLAMALERELAGSDTKHNRSSPKISSRSVHGNYTKNLFGHKHTHSPCNCSFTF